MRFEFLAFKTYYFMIVVGLEKDLYKTYFATSST